MTGPTDKQLGDTGETAPARPPRPDTDRAPVAEPAATLAVGTSVGRYVLLGSLGAGGMGQVYSAFDPELDRRVALKLLLAEPTSSRTASTGQARLVREAQAMARLSHPNVVSVFDVGTFGDRVFVTMELVEGRTLKAWLHESPHPWRQCLEMCLQAGRGLAAAHAAGLVHRDFKPDNVLVGKDGRARVTDFGLARAEGAPPEAPSEPSAVTTTPTHSGSHSNALSTPLTEVGAVMGTPGYMAPEQLRAEAGDARTDQFSFSVTLYEALYGQRPFPGKGLVQYLAALTKHAPLPAPRKESGVPAWVEQHVFRGLSLDPLKRFPDMDALLRALSSDPWERRRRYGAAGAAVLALGAAAAGAVTLEQRHSRLCEGATEEFAAVWSPAAQAHVEAAFRATDKPFADGAWRGTQRLLSEYGAHWAAMRTDSCKATRLQGVQPDTVLGLRTVCLDRRLDQVRALVGLLEKANADVVSASVRAASSLPSVDGCADVEALTAVVQPPEDPQVRARVNALRGQLHQVWALVQLGRAEEADALAAKLAPEADKVGYAPLTSAAYLWLGRADRWQAKYQASADFLRRAAWEGIASRDDEDASAAASDEAVSLGGLGKLDEAEVWVDLARSLVTRQGSPLQRRAEVEWATGQILLFRNKPDAAIPHWIENVRLSSQAGAEFWSASALQLLGSAYVSAGRDREAIAVLDAATRAIRRLFGSEHPEIAAGDNFEAYVLWRLGYLGQALQIQAESLAISAPSMGGESGPLAEILLNVSDTERRLGFVSAAKALVDLALQIEARTQDGLSLAQAMEGRGAALSAAGKHTEALADFVRERQSVEKTFPGEHETFASALRNEGLERLTLGDRAAAVTTLERALAQFKASQTFLPEDLADTRFGLARVLWDVKDRRGEALALAADAAAGFAGEPLAQAKLDGVSRWLIERAQ